LPDGSRVTLGASSAITIQFSADRRRVNLLRGEALFQVSHNPQRPFVVAAGTRTITAVGTAFVVRRDSDRVEVAVTDGTVSVMPQGSSSTLLLPFLPHHRATHSQEALITGGQRVTYDDAGLSTPIEPADADAVTGWRKGRLEFDHQPMRYVIETVNRYSRQTIQLDSDTARQVYTGLILQDQIDDWVRALPRSYPIQLLEHGHDICLRSLHPTAPAPPSAPCDDSP
jgi:transmembrane sensor